MVLSGKSHGSFGRVHTFYHHLYLIHGFLHCLSLTDQDAGSAVSGMHAGTGYNQITDSGESVEGLRFTAHCHSQTGDFMDSSGNQGCLGVISVAQSVCNTCSQCHHIFQGTAQFNPQYIRTGIHPEHITHKIVLQRFCHLAAVSSHYDAGGKSPAYLFRMGGSG